MEDNKCTGDCSSCPNSLGGNGCDICNGETNGDSKQESNSDQTPAIMRMAELPEYELGKVNGFTLEEQEIIKGLRKRGIILDEEDKHQ